VTWRTRPEVPPYVLALPLPLPGTPLRPRRVLPLLAFLVGATTGCGEAPAAFGPTPTAARAHASDLLSAIALRFGPVPRDARLASARPRYVRHALSPSRIFDDTTIWTARPAPNVRELTMVADPTPGPYVLRLSPPAAPPSEPGAFRATMAVRREREEDVYRWHSRAELAAGSIGARQLMAAIVAALATAGDHSATELRAGYRDALPRTTAALGQLFSLDSLRVTPGPDGTAALALGIRIDADGVRPRLPTFATWLEKYVSPARYTFRLRDPAPGGALWLEAAAREDFLTLRFRVRDGRLTNLTGAPRPLPDSLRFEGEFYAKVLIFTVGMSDMVGTFTPVRTDHEQGFAIHLRQEPDWHFPLAVHHLISSSLERPFQGEGVLYRITALERPGASTLLTRDLGLAVQESAIVRWIGRLSSTAIQDVNLRVERERDQFVGEAFTALRDDLRAAIPSSAMVLEENGDVIGGDSLTRSAGSTPPPPDPAPPR
jgi:hypothetical protein